MGVVIAFARPSSSRNSLCSRTYTEIIPIVYTRTHFSFDSKNTFLFFAHSIPAPFLQNIRTLTIDYFGPQNSPTGYAFWVDVRKIGKQYNGSHFVGVIKSMSNLRSLSLPFSQNTQCIHDFEYTEWRMKNVETCARGALRYYKCIRQVLPSTCRLLVFIEMSKPGEGYIFKPRFEQGQVVEILQGDEERAMVVGIWNYLSETVWLEPREVAQLAPSDSEIAPGT
ncbi:hypothetical protein B0J11DRAFT_501300 [Dendryphion nanum]|uniref:DUF7730 domain-containing protein n=1 Tax=Dendryphion nanum TaxID=256645 RepID=A0A9P9J1X6_9PLEO|nr:hypothetical protein B0J11DRAFT_501300 [Dendryphion nanum]